jgi:MYXO-CTERM domain-containing protein
VVPDNFYEMEINPARINWFRQGNNYEELVKRAADEAGGNAFVTEFAGPAALLKDRLYLPGRYNLDTVARAATPPDALDRIGEMGFPRDNTLLIVLRKHIPVPQVLKAMGIDERTFFNQLRFYWGQYQQQFAPFDARALAADLEATYVTPLKQAQELFDRHARLTRLATFISPEEMNVDPTFVVNDNLPDVPALRTAVANVICGDRQHTACTAPVRLEVPGTDPIWFLPRPQPYCYGRSFDYDRANLDAMPALYRAWQRTDIGEGVARMDRRDAIGSAIRSHNDAAASSTPLPPVPMSPVPGLSPPGSTPPLSPVGGLGPGAPPAPTPTPLTPSGGGGCSCRTAGADDRAPGPLPLALFLLPLARRLRRRRPPERIQR